MSRRVCDACEKEFGHSVPNQDELYEGEIRETLDVSGFKYDLCDECGARLFGILAEHSWKPVKAAE